MNAMNRDMYKAVNGAFMQLNTDDEAKVGIFLSRLGGDILLFLPLIF